MFKLEQKSLSGTLMVLLLALGWPVFGEEKSGPDLFIPDSQDQELMAKAWRTQVKIEYKNTSTLDILKDLAKQGGLEIRWEDRALKEALHEKVGGSGSGGGTSLQIIPAGKARAHHFLSEQEAQKIAYIPGKFEYEGLKIKEFSAERPAPLVLALESFLGYLGWASSYRKGHIFLAPVRQLLPELSLTRSVKLRQTWGSVYRVNYNGEDKVFRLNLLDTGAFHLLQGQPHSPGDQEWDQATRVEGGNPTGAFERMRKLNRGLDVRFNAASKALTVTAHAKAVADFMAYRLPELEKTTPEELASEACAFKDKRLRQAAENAWKAQDAPRQAELKRLVQRLNDDDYESREKAETALVAAGPAGAFPLLAADLGKAGKELTLRRQRILPRIYAEHESKEILGRAQAYFQAGLQGDFQRIQDEFWTPARISAFAEAGKTFERERKAAREDPALWKQFLENHWLASTPNPEKVSYRQTVLDRMKMVEHRIEAVQFAGSKARLTFSMKLAADHPAYPFVERLKKDYGIELPVDSFFLEFDGQKWRAGEEEPLSDKEMLTWTREKGLSGEGSVPKAEKVEIGSSVAVAAGAACSTVSASACAYSIKLGY